MKKLPADVTPTTKTPEFTELTVPDGLLNNHQTKRGVWGKIVVLEGDLEYTIVEPIVEVVLLNRGNHGVVEPTVLHHVRPLGAVRFYVQFHR